MALLNQLASDPKAASLVSMATTASGVSTWLDWIPNDIGKLATVVGVILSTVLIFYWIQKSIIEVRRGRLEIKKLKKDLEDAP